MLDVVTDGGGRVRSAEDGQPCIAVADLKACDAELRTLLGHVRAFYTSAERRSLYSSNEHLGVALAKVVLRLAGHPLEPRPGGLLTVAVASERRRRRR